MVKKAELLNVRYAKDYPIGDLVEQEMTSSGELMALEGEPPKERK